MSLEIGNKAPDFEAKDQDGNTIKLSDYKGKKVVLYFYPKDNTPGCTAQACDLRDHYDALLDAGYVVLGISTDSEKSHKKFIEKHELPFPLIADEDKAVHELYNTWREKKNYGRTYMGTVRTTFVIDEEGKIAEIIEKVKTKEHSNQILK
ncbi:thioredoxin-dependent thiol peroxidase [Echinicola vietnamensis]|uniref:thioredoxin-dependent peroxiredoxin n=1 Tax=Echinicola vietnamensis (strain DSM 17526 / LMG 23754 / KMM 6221) TaxID=926556 RepID=L0G2F0_ECHVK|nr:thioredoxin-dependent thiol peroxidase [Echinicola vietnamensis]AGA79166.1 Peroxiredoxin [Echinicola vietnamensis DSM 17526]